MSPENVALSAGVTLVCPGMKTGEQSKHADPRGEPSAPQLQLSACGAGTAGEARIVFSPALKVYSFAVIHGKHYPRVG